MGQAEKAARSFGKAAENSEDDVKKLGKTAKQAGEEVKRFGDDFQTAANKADKAFSNLKSTIIGLGIGQALKTSITDAMNAVESESLFEVSLGDYANKARAWSEEMSKSLALDGYALRKNVGTLYSMTTSMGLSKDASYELSTGLSALAEDMASFYNLSSDEAFTKLRSGLTGEAEPLKAIGILVDEATVKQYAYRSGIAKTGEELTQQEKVLARYAAILGQTANAQGDLARTMDSPANQLRATMNDLKQVSIEFGMALMPIVQTGLPILRQGIEDIAPVATTFASGLSFIGQALQILENPVARGIVYAGVAAAAIRKLNLAIGSTASGLILIGSILTFVLGKYAEAEQKAEDTVATSMDGATVAINSATTSTENLADSFGEVEKAVNRLAGFDEITKLSGGSSGLVSSQFANIANSADDAAAAVADYENAISSLSSGGYSTDFGIDLTKVDWAKLKEDVEALGNDIVTAFTGSEEESYQALKRLNDRVSILFGEEFTKFWQGVGNDIYTAFNGAENDSYAALYRLNERIKQIPFGDVFVDTFKKAGEGFERIASGIELLKNGDFAGAISKFSEAASNENTVATAGAFASITRGNPMFNVGAAVLNSELGQKAVDYVGDYADAVSESDKTRENILKDKGFQVAEGFLEGVDNFGKDFATLGQGEMASTWGIVEGWSNFWQGIGRWIAESTSGEVTTPVTREDVHTIVNNPTTTANGNVTITNKIELDGEPIKQWTKDWQSEDVSVTNGKQ